MNRMNLSQILAGSQRDTLSRAWDSSPVAEDFGALPAGEYIAHVTEGSAARSKSGTPGYKLTFKVAEGPYKGRLFWHDLWLTPAALPMTKRDLGKLGVKTLDQLDSPLPKGIRCRVKLVLRVGDDGREYNRVRSFEVVSIDRPEPDPFAPREAEAPVADQQAKGPAAEEAVCGAGTSPAIQGEGGAE
jgi:hypothetical protein